MYAGRYLNAKGCTEEEERRQGVQMGKLFVLIFFCCHMRASIALFCGYKIKMYRNIFEKSHLAFYLVDYWRRYLIQQCSDPSFKNVHLILNHLKAFSRQLLSGDFVGFFLFVAFVEVCMHRTLLCISKLPLSFVYLPSNYNCNKILFYV